MNLSSEYRQQFGWRAWPKILDALPPVRGQVVLDVGCAVGDQAAEFVARGARVIGVDIDHNLIEEARSRKLPNTDFRQLDLRTLPDLGVMADGLWCSFSAAYFPELPTMLVAWSRNVRPGGWIALTEIDDLFGHQPLSARAKGLLEEYAHAALVAKRYDFHMGHKLRDHLERSGFQVFSVLTVEDQELSFDGPAPPEVVEAWRKRFDRMTLLRDICGDDFENVREEFLCCLSCADHRSLAKVYCSIARKCSLTRRACTPMRDPVQAAGANDEERGHVAVPIRASLARSSSSVNFALARAMRTPKSRTLLFLAAGFFLLASISIPNFYPTPIPVLGRDGNPFFSADGNPVVHRDMGEFYRMNTPAFIFLACSVFLFAWWLLKSLKSLCGRFIERVNDMKACPDKIGGARVICHTLIDHRHRFSGGCKQIVRGELMGQMAGLAICQYVGEEAFYLFGCDADWQNVTDTWHQTLDDAKHQAEFEYQGVSKTWIFPEPTAPADTAPPGRDV